jgi:hypothetical protein
MDDTFSFRAPPVPLHRRVDARAVKVAVTGLVLLSSVVAFSRWVIESERRSETRAAAHATGEPAVGLIAGAEVDEVASPTLPVLDGPARADARTALAAAREAMRGRGTVVDAGPAQLSAIEGSLTFTDGPSPAPGIVSVAARGDDWAAAVMGASGQCYWVKIGANGSAFGTGSLCTGIVALSADAPVWQP